MSETRELRVGMVGAGFIGQLAHLMNLVEIPRCRVVALAELRPVLRERVCRRFGIPRSYATHAQMLEDPEVEAVVVVTPRPYTYRTVKDCLLAGKHVLSEKPMAGDYRMAEELVEIARQRGVRYIVGYMKRYDGGVQLAKRLLDGLRASEELGPVTFVRAHCFMGDSYCRADGHVVTDEKPDYVDGGDPIAPVDIEGQLGRDFAFYLNTYSHNTNLLRHLFGAIPRVHAVRFGNPLGRLAMLDFTDFVASLETGRLSCRGWDEVTEVYFRDGRLTLRTPPGLLKNVPAQVELYRAGDIQVIESPQVPWEWAFRRQAAAFVEDVLEGRPSLCEGRDALQDVKLIEEMWRMERDRPGQDPVRA